MSELKAVVCTLVDEYRFAINKGSNDGVQWEDRFYVYETDKPVEIYDPTTGELLDTLHRVKASFLATEVKARYSLCEMSQQFHPPIAYWHIIRVGDVAERA